MMQMLNGSDKRPLNVVITYPDGMIEEREIVALETSNDTRYAVGRSAAGRTPYLSDVRPLKSSEGLVATGKILNHHRFGDGTEFQTTRIVSVVLVSGQKLDTTMPGTQIGLSYEQAEASPFPVPARDMRRAASQRPN